MGHSKQNKGKKKDGNHRNETREERMERMKEQEEAREACFKIVPYVGGFVLLLLIIFGGYVSSVPQKAPKAKKATKTRTSSRKTSTPTITTNTNNADGGASKTMNINMEDAMDADGNIKLTPEMLKQMGLEGQDVKVVPQSPPEGETTEAPEAAATTTTSAEDEAAPAAESTAEVHGEL